MLKCTFLGAVCVFAVNFGAAEPLLAQSHPLQPDVAFITGAKNDWTVLTMAPDGSWGAATEITTNLAIARAIANCKLMSQADIGCGAYFTTIRAGWSLGLRCGRENIVVAATELADAEQAAAYRERELRQLFTPGMPACLRVVTVDPEGVVLAPKVEYPSGFAVAADDTSTPVESGESTAPAAPPMRARSAGDFPVWKTVMLGTYRDVNMLLEDLDSHNCGLEDSSNRKRTASIAGTTTPLPCALGEAAGQIIARPAFTLNTNRAQADLVVVSVPELGFDGERAAVADIYARARQLGLELCSAEVGAQLRLQYLDQPRGEFLRVAMEPIATYGGELIDLTVANDGASLSLLGGGAHADALVDPSVRFVFVRPTRIAAPNSSQSPGD